jgi:hypothetical protein
VESLQAILGKSHIGIQDDQKIPAPPPQSLTDPGVGTCSKSRVCTVEQVGAARRSYQLVQAAAGAGVVIDDDREKFHTL